MGSRAYLFGNRKTAQLNEAWKISLDTLKTNNNSGALMELTKRESDVLQLLLIGKTNKQIALDLSISDYTVRDHVSSLLRKRGVRNRMELMAKQVRL
jgi:DNA-binding NarL/FixJ family response regulator